MLRALRALRAAAARRPRALHAASGPADPAQALLEGLGGRAAVDRERLRGFAAANAGDGDQEETQTPMGPGPVRALLARLGAPERDFAVVHVVGSKGKGSTGAFVAAALRAAGHRVGVFSSPHVATVRERLSVAPDGAPVPLERFAALLASHAPAVEAAWAEGELSQFELLTALALKFFSEERVDVAVVEAGLGGRDDATNVFPAANVVLAVLTTVDFEHTDVLGGSLAEIVTAKLAVAPPGTPVVVAPQLHAEVRPLVAAALAGRCPAIFAADILELREAEAAGRTWRAGGGEAADAEPYWARIRLRDAAPPGDEAEGALVFLRMLRRLQERGPLPLGLAGAPQLLNAATALVACVELAAVLRLEPRHLACGLRAARLPGRLQRVWDAPLGHAVVLDGAHSPAAAALLTQSLSGREAFGAVLAMASDKDPGEFTENLLRLAPQLRTLVCTRVPIAGGTQRSAAAADLAAAAVAAQAGGDAAAGVEVGVAETLEDALWAAAEGLPEGGTVLVTGSLYAVQAYCRVRQLEP